MFLRHKLLNTIGASALLAVLTACGGGSGGGSSSADGAGSGSSNGSTATGGNTSGGTNNGGSSGSGANGSGDFSQRVTRVMLDYDNNGIVDAEENHSYDSAGRLVQTNYQYIGDGTTDILVTQDPRALSIVDDYEYNSDGRISRWSRVLTPFDANTFGSGNARTDLSYQYNNEGLIDSVVLENFLLSGALIATLNFDLEYNAGRLTRVVQQTQGFGVSIDIFTDFLYGSNGLPDSAIMSNPATTFNGLSIPASIIAENNFLWDNDLRTSSYTFLAVDPNILTQLDTTYTSLGSVDVQDFTSNNNADKTLWSNDSTWVFNYDSGDNLLDNIVVDMNRNGSEDVVISMEWEAERCASVYLWHPALLPLYPFESFTAQENLPSAILPGTGYRKNGLCAR